MTLNRKNIKSKKNIKKEAKLRNNCLEGFCDFIVLFMTTSTIHGLRFIVCTSLHPIERFFWFTTVVLTVYGAGTLSLSTWTRFQENPTVVSMERNYKDWNTSFPSVTVCPMAKYDEMNLEKILNKEFLGIKDKISAIEFIRELSNATYGKFGSLKNMAEEIKPSTYLSTLWKISYPFMYNISTSDQASYIQSGMNPVITEVGICYSYNSVTAVYNKPEVWETNHWEFIRGLRVLEGSPLDGDIFAQLTNMNSGYGVDISSYKFPGINDMKNATEFIKELSNATYGYFKYIKTMTTDELSPSIYWKVLWKIVPHFRYQISTSDLVSYNQTEMNQVLTEVGICYSYNSVTTAYNKPEIWETNSLEYIRGLRIFESSPLDGDIMAKIMDMESGYGLYILDPSEFPDVAIPQLIGFNNTYKTIDLTALSIVSTEEVKSLSIQQRKCRLPQESNLMASPVYSYNLCRMECRMKECYKLCKCIPYFYRPTGKYPICDLKGMQCLDKHSERLIRMIDPDTGHKVSCHCLQLCDEVTYVVDTHNTMAWTLGTNLKWGLIKYPKFRLKRDILFGQRDLLVAIGGTAGLFLGCSVLSFAEIVYFFTLHLAWFILRRNKNR